MLKPVVIIAIVFVSGGVLGAAIQKLVVRATALHRPASGEAHVGEDAHVGARGAQVGLKASGKILPKAKVAATVAIAAPAPPATMSTFRASAAVAGPEGGEGDRIVVRAPPRTSRTGGGPRAMGPPAPVAVGPPPPPVDLSSPVEAPRRLVEEHTLLARVIQRLRVEGHAADALIALDDYGVRYPAGSLAPEAAALRAETLLKLGRKAEAIRTLSELLARPLPGNEERRVLRGELLASLGSWRGASADFDQALLRADEGTPDSRQRSSLVERALWGRAVARNHLGEGPGSRADLTEYLRRFPQGAFALQAARALERSP
jgi:hypothetical protein